MRSVISCLLFGIIFFISSIEGGFTEGTTCSPGKNYIILSSHPAGYVCLSNDFYQGISYTISDYKNRLNTGEDINTVLTELRGQMQNAAMYNPGTDYGTMYAIVIDRIKTFAKERCNITDQKPEIFIPNGSIYLGQTLTPICQSRKYKSGDLGIQESISISYTDPRLGKIFYTKKGNSFSGVVIDKIGAGEHIISCSYKSNYCLNPNIVRKKIQVGGNTQIQKKQQSTARMWNEVILDAIRLDQVRPPIQARNLFHFSAAMYDIWGAYHTGNTGYLFDNPAQTRFCTLPHKKIESDNIALAMEKAMSYAAYRIIIERYKESPGYTKTVKQANDLMNSLGYNVNYTGKDIEKGTDPGTLGNYIADCYIRYGLIDGSNEKGTYANTHYAPKNTNIDPRQSGNPTLQYPDNWQPIALEVFIDQGGNKIAGGAASFIGAEWGAVKPFSFREDQKKIYSREEMNPSTGEQKKNTYPVYLDPGNPPSVSGERSEEYIWNFALVGVWSSHLDPKDGKKIDISPRSLGKSSPLPKTFEEMKHFYDIKNGGTKSLGRVMNLKTNEEYSENQVLRGDYTRAIAEFWADGPKSETPPGHWFKILNDVSDKISKKQWKGNGPIIDSLEWDVKSYFTLGGAMHDAAIGAWGAKGWYDGVRPISAIRYMADHGQSTDPKLPSYSPIGLPLIPGYIELIEENDILAGKEGKNIGKVKIRAWKGPKYIDDPEVDIAGVDWILASNWWAYQRPSFVTPPFGGYISGHSTFSRAAAEVLTNITGDEYFPGGLYEVPVKKNNYLVFEQGPSTSFTLQWATYRDASDACSISRIWGGIHPPIDDIAGRIMGEKIGKQAFNYAETFFKK